MTRLDTFTKLAEVETDACVEWPYGTDMDGYGQFKNGGQNVRCGRQSLTMRTPPPSSKYHAAHGPCHNPLCMNYRHLTWKTSSENQIDRERDGTGNKGERHGRALVGESDVIEMRRRHAGGESIASLGRRFGLARSSAASAIHRRTWQHIAA